LSSKAESSSLLPAETRRSDSAEAWLRFTFDLSRGLSTHGDGTAKTEANQMVVDLAK
jgi:hypothetical protein